MSRLILVTDAAEEPVSLETARLHLRLDADGSPPSHPLDDLISLAISGARDWAEQFTGLQLVERAYEYRLAAFADPLDLPVWPVRSVEYVAYLDGDGVEQTLDPNDYVFQAGDDDTPARLVLAAGADWPETDGSEECVRIGLITGYGDPADSPPAPLLPAALRIALLVHVGHAVDHPDQPLPPAVELHLRPHRRRLGLA